MNVVGFAVPEVADYRLRPAEEAAGREQRGPRYAVAIQLPTLIVAPTSTSAQPAIFRPEIEMDGS